MARVITDAQRQEWARMDVTREFLANLHASRQETMQAWAREGYVQETGEGTLMANAKALGGIDCLNKLIEQLEELLIDEEVFA